MKCYSKAALASLLVVVLLVTTPLLACGDDEGEEQKTVITIGYITDLTGPSGPALVPMYWALQDLVKHINEEDPIPGAELRVVAYDGRMDPARTISGYEWLKEKGADVLFVIFDYDAQVLTPFAERDKIPIFTFMGFEALVEPPGWVFVANTFRQWEAGATLKWIGEEWDTTEGVLKIGAITHTTGSYVAADEMLRQYCQDHQERFEWIGSFRVPFTTMNWAGEVEALKDADWIGFPGIVATSLASFIEQYRAKGYTAKFFGDESMPSFMGFILDRVGWEAIDGSVLWAHAAWWTDPYPVVDLAKELLQKYHPAEAEEAIRSGIGYVGGFIQQYFLLQLVRAAIEEVGAENLDGQALYDTAVNFSLPIEGLGEWGFSSTERTCVDHFVLHEVSAEAEDLVIISDRIPVLKE